LKYVFFEKFSILLPNLLLNYIAFLIKEFSSFVGVTHEIKDDEHKIYILNIHILCPIWRAPPSLNGPLTPIHYCCFRSLEDTFSVAAVAASAAFHVNYSKNLIIALAVLFYLACKDKGRRTRAVESPDPTNIVP